jgi:hypothetical protein
VRVPTSVLSIISLVCYHFFVDSMSTFYRVVVSRFSVVAVSLWDTGAWDIRPLAGGPES